MPWPSIDQLSPPPTDTRFTLQPLGPEHNERDHEAWMTSIEHIHDTPGFSRVDNGADSWPVVMTLDENLSDLVMHAAEFAAGEAYAYSVIDPATDDVIGCLYVDPDDTPQEDPPEHPGPARAKVTSWVRVDRAELDRPLAETVAAWLKASGAFRSVRWPGRPDLNC